MIYINLVITGIKSKCQLNAYFKQQVEKVKNDVVDSKYYSGCSNAHILSRR